MKNSNNYALIFIAGLIIIGFGGTLLIKYLIAGDILILHLITTLIGLVMAIVGGINILRFKGYIK